MAVIHKGSNGLKGRATKFLILSILFWIVPFVYILAFFQGFHFDGLFHLVPIMVGWFGVYFWRKYSTLQSGVRGESRTANVLQGLPSEYEVFSSVQISTSSGTAELDHVIVSENGVFVVEVKNHNGTIDGREEDHTWTQHKIGRKGGEYSKEMRNPVKQVRRQVHILSDYLKQNQSRVWIEGVVYFSNPQAEVNVRTSRTPVFDSSFDLHEYLTNYEPKRKISSAEMKKVRKLIG